MKTIITFGRIMKYDKEGEEPNRPLFLCLEVGRNKMRDYLEKGRESLAAADARHEN